MSGQTIQILSSISPTAVTEPLDSNDGYGDEAILCAIREWHNLDKSYAICLDLERVFPYLAREYRDAFRLYAAGLTTAEIACYWAKMKGGGTANRFRGRDVLKRLVREIQRYLKMYQYTLNLADDDYLKVKRTNRR